MSLLTYCKTCLYPSSKPDLSFNSEGVCSACTAFKERENIDWVSREQQFRNICEELKKQDLQYHIVVPVSGGKDSTAQILKALEYGLRPLAVTATTDHISPIGRDNLDNIGKLGVDHIEVSPNRKLRYKINKYTLEEIGDISWSEHTTIFSIPIRIALQFNIPYVLYGENPQSEYGGPNKKSQEAVELNQRWLEEFGGLNGLRVSDIIDAGIATKNDMHLYSYPKIKEGTIAKAIWMGQFFPWSGLDNALLASQNGFKCHFGPVEGIGYSFENLDNGQTGLRDFLKWVKFGYGRCTDLVCNHIRRRHITREEGKEIVLMFDGAWPSTYLGISLEEILEPVGVTVDDYIKIVRQFTNKKLFRISEKRPRPMPLFLEDFKNG